jgi:hypothetical protein
LVYRDRRRVYLAFEFEKDAQRRNLFIRQAQDHCDYQLEDYSLPAAIHDKRWQGEARKLIQQCSVLIVLLGQDTHSSQGVNDEVSIAANLGCPIVQLMPQHNQYGTISDNFPVIRYRWNRLNEMLRDPKTFIQNNKARKT